MAALRRWLRLRLKCSRPPPWMLRDASPTIRDGRATQDGNGTISSSEFRQQLAALGVAGEAREVAALFAKLDLDGSGELCP